MEIRRGGARISGFPYDKVQALLAYLLLEPPTPHPRQRLAGLLWPSQEESAARHSLRQALSQLRKTLSEGDVDVPLIFASRNTIRRNPEALLEVDVASFEKCLEQAAAREEDEDAHVQDLAKAAEHYRGKLLPQLSLVESAPFQQWLQRRRRQVHRRAVRALEQLLEADERRHDEQQLMRHAQKLLELEPWRETAHRRLMLLLARRGQRAAALKQYERCRQSLDEMLDATPEPQTERLHRRIRQMASARVALPTPPTPFISRRRELERLLDDLRRPDRQLVTVVALGGMGKTRLAIEAGVRAAQEGTRLFLHGVVFVPLDGVGNLDHLVARVAGALDFSYEGQNLSAEPLLRYLQEKEMLLILDQFEHLLNEACLNFLSALLEEAPDVMLLVTSRRRLGLHGEQLLPLDGLPLPQEEEQTGAVTGEEESALDFLLASMRRLQPTVERLNGERADAADICRLVAGMPLALEMAASWTDTLSLREIARALQDNLDLLQTSAADVASRHHSIRAMFATTWQRLEEAQRQVMAQIAIFRGGFTLAAAQAVSDVSPPVLAGLVRRSLVQYDTGRDRYDLHPLVQQFGAEKVAEEGVDDAALHARHSAYYLHWLEQRAGELRGVDEGIALQKMDLEMANLRQAWQWATQHAAVEQLDAAASAFHHYYQRRGRYQEGAETFAGALQSMREAPTTGLERVEARLLAFHADMLRQQNETAQARARLEESLSLLQQATLQKHDARREKAFIWWRMALLTSDAAEARPLLQKSLDLYRRLGDDGRTAELLATLGLLLKATGDLHKAEACFDESMALRRSLATPAPVVKLSYFLAELRMRQGQFAESETLLQEGLARVREIGDRPSVAQGLVQWIIHCMYVGRFEEAADIAREAAVTWEEVGRQTGVCRVWCFQSQALFEAGHFRQARRVAEQALSLTETFDSAPYAGSALLSVGAVLLLEGKAVAAYKKLCQSAEIYEEGWRNDWRARQAVSRAYAACALCHQDELARARTTLDEALKVVIEVRSLIGLLSTMPAIALWQSKDGQIGRAIETWTAACSQPHVANSQWFAEIVGSPVEQAAASLSDDDIAAAKERGRDRQLWDLAHDLAARLPAATAPPTLLPEGSS